MRKFSSEVEKAFLKAMEKRKTKSPLTKRDVSYSTLKNQGGAAAKKYQKELAAFAKNFKGSGEGSDSGGVSKEKAQSFAKSLSKATEGLGLSKTEKKQVTAALSSAVFTLENSLPGSSQVISKTMKSKPVKDVMEMEKSLPEKARNYISKTLSSVKGDLTKAFSKFTSKAKSEGKKEGISNLDGKLKDGMKKVKAKSLGKALKSGDDSKEAFFKKMLGDNAGEKVAAGVAAGSALGSASLAVVSHMATQEAAMKVFESDVLSESMNSLNEAASKKISESIEAKLTFEHGGDFSFMEKANALTAEGNDLYDQVEKISASAKDLPKQIGDLQGFAEMAKAGSLALGAVSLVSLGALGLMKYKKSKKQKKKASEFKTARQRKIAALNKFAKVKPEKAELVFKTVLKSVPRKIRKFLPEIAKSMTDLSSSKKALQAEERRLESVLAKKYPEHKGLASYIKTFFSEKSIPERARALLAFNRGQEEFFKAIGYTPSGKRASLAFLSLPALLVVYLVLLAVRTFFHSVFSEFFVLVPMKKIPTLLRQKVMAIKESFFDVMDDLGLTFRNLKRDYTLIKTLFTKGLSQESRDKYLDLKLESEVDSGDLAKKRYLRKWRKRQELFGRD